MMKSPYANKKENEWLKITKRLVEKHPLKECLVQIVLKSWDSIFKSNFDSYRIGKDFFPEPQIMGFFLHDIIALHLNKVNHDYRIGDAGKEKDVVCISNESLSFEIKTSSHNNQIFGNRSYAQKGSDKDKKHKDGFFLAINFEKFNLKSKQRPEIKLIRFGFLEHGDWIAQKSPKGQQAHLPTSVYEKKFVTLYTREQV